MRFDMESRTYCTVVRIVTMKIGGDDYQDVMDGVDALLDKGIAREDQLYVTGGSAGGIMTAWIIGKNT
ncbi:MAG: prolyl oligopeptidase family serine peptidase, partial [Gammaproteobacteria bacterium]|nr:prolyl oligopeptidase family serine peptidase [Gammaproteobacteria bacterium]